MMKSLDSLACDTRRYVHSHEATRTCNWNPLYDRYLHRYYPEDIAADVRLYLLWPKEDADEELLAAVFNSTVVQLFFEVVGRVTLGKGTLEMKVDEMEQQLPFPDIRQFSEDDIQAIKNAFQPLLKRRIEPVSEEAQRRDRAELDRAVLRALGVKPDVYLSALQDGAIEMCQARVRLWEMRRHAQKWNGKKAIQDASEVVIREILPKGPARFPDDFMPPAVRAGSFNEIALPVKPLRYKGHLWGKEELATDDGQTLHVANKFEVRYVLFAQVNRQKVARLPSQPVEVSRAVSTYTQYLRDLRERLRQAYFTRTLDQAAAERFVAETWRKLELPENEE